MPEQIATVPTEENIPDILPPDPKGFGENAADVASRHVLNLFVHANKKQWAEFQVAAQEKEQLRSRLNFLTNRDPECAERFEGCNIQIGRFLEKDLVFSCAENLQRISPNQIPELMTLLAQSDFVQRHSEKILAELRKNLIDGPQKELADFKAENKGKLRQHGLI